MENQKAWATKKPSAKSAKPVARETRETETGTRETARAVTRDAQRDGQKPWEAEGVSRATYFRRLKAKKPAD